MINKIPLDEMINCRNCLDEENRCTIHSFYHTDLRKLAHNLINVSLKNLPVRKKHTEAVAKRMEELCGTTPSFVKSYCYSIGLLHDIGYGYIKTGHHAIDGALYLQTTVLSDLAPYVAWHSTSKYEAQARNLTIDFDKPLSKYMNDQLWYADFTTSPEGELVTVSERLAEIRTRYSPDSQVIEALNNSMNDMVEAFAKFEQQNT